FVEGLFDRGDVAFAIEDGGDVRPADDGFRVGVFAGFFFQFVHGDRDAKFLEAGNDLGIARVAAFDELTRHLAEDGAVRVDSVTQEVKRAGVRVFSADFDAGEEVNAQAPSFRGGFVDSPYRVMVGEGEGGETSISG